MARGKIGLRPEKPVVLDQGPDAEAADVSGRQSELYSKVAGVESRISID